MKEKIAIIGAGNMGQAIAQGLVRKKIVTKKQLICTNSQTNNNISACEKADIIILAIKPQLSSDVLEEIKHVIKNQLIISIMAGISIGKMESILGSNKAIIRSMPNLAAQTGNAMTAWVKNKNVSQKQEEIVKTILQTIGKEVFLKDEMQLNAVTAISGSGPAYFLYITEILEQVGKQFGFSHDVVSILAKQTLIGSASLLEQSKKSPEELRKSIMSKGGTTEAAFRIFAQEDLSKIFIKGVKAAKARAEELNQ